ncbi:MAG: hypothetical protein KHX45_24765 [Clostridiales bacterium]|nr:hypothetical protein [Clostridiales bacterium]
MDMFRKKYDFAAKNGSEVKIEIAVEIENLDCNDMQEILHEYALRTRNFYLSMGNEINSKL